MDLIFNRKFVLLGLILLIVPMIVGGITLWTLYETHLEETRNRLIEIVQSRARFMESLAAFDQKHSADFPGGPQEATLSQIRQAHDRFKGFGDTGEFTVGRREGDRIVFVVRHRHADFDKPQPVPFAGHLAVPMRLALSGESGSVIGLDYRGVEVVAAYEPVSILNLGLVAKIDLEEVRSRYVRAGLLLFSLTCGIVAVGELLFYWISKPLLRRVRAALRRSEERLQLILEGTNDGVWDWNLCTGDISFSPKAEQMLGFSPGELVPHFQSWVDRLHPEDRERVLQGLGEHVAGRIDSHSLEYRLRTRAGGWVWIQGRGKVVEWDQEGRPWRMAGTYTDITMRKEAELELNRMNRALKALSSASEALLHAQDEEQFMTTLCQLIVEKAGYRLAWCGFARHDPGKSVVPMAQFGYETGYLDSLRISWGDGPSGQGPTGRAIRTGMPAHARDILNDPDFVPWRDQAMARGYRSSLSLPLVSDGEVFGALSVYAAEPEAFDPRETAFLMDLARDISFGIMALRAHANSRRLASAIEQTEDMVLVADTGGVIQYVNQAFCRVTGYTADEVISRNITILDAGEFKQEIADEIERTLAVGQTWKGHFLNRKKDGSLFDVESSISPVKSPDGSVRNYVAVYRDITRQLRMERQLRQAQKMKAIGTLAGGIAHDFNNLLGIILGYTELVMGKIPASDQKYQDLQDVFLAGKRAKDLVAQLLTFSRMSEGERQSIRVSPVLKETLQFMRASVPTTIAIHTHISQPEVMILGDPTQLHQVIMNLCTNAAFAMEEKGGVMGVTLTTVVLTEEEASTLDVAPGPYAVLIVEDTGVGIEPDIRDRLFDPFFSTREIGKGTGLGLSVVHGIVTEAKGTVQVQSVPGRGSTFQVYWPLVVSESEIVPEGSASVFRPDRPFRVLFVDDETSIARLGKMQLEQLGYQVECCSDPGLAWKRFQRDPDQYDVIISDQTMPGMTGIELLTRIHTLHAGLPGILCSGKKDPVSPEQMRTLGIRAVLRKPVLKEELGRVLHDVFNNRNASEADRSGVEPLAAVGTGGVNPA
ncbi:MAG: PAS domain S-box protein [Magnetococcales bacterium]|nr:PAS domain S-box protein [Magnetococcales bacterium]